MELNIGDKVKNNIPRLCLCIGTKNQVCVPVGTVFTIVDKHIMARFGSSLRILTLANEQCFTFVCQPVKDDTDDLSSDWTIITEIPNVWEK